VPGSYGSRRATAAAHAVAALLLCAAQLSAHRRDEYLQAARLAIDPDAVQLQLDLTPGIAVAESVIADIDGDRDGTLSAGEQRAYAGLVLGAVRLEIDGRPLAAALTAAVFPDVEAMRRGEGTIRMQASASAPRLAAGPHHLLFRNSHHRDGGVYLANALVPDSERVAVTAQRRDAVQSELTIDYVLRAAPVPRTAAWLLTGTAVLMGLWMARLRRPRRVI
jgi:hypothetical protein